MEKQSDKLCIKCGVTLDSTTTTWYRAKNYIHKCNDCIREEKREFARNLPNEVKLSRTRKYTENLKNNNPVKYTARQMANSASKRAKALGRDYDLSTEYIESICFDTRPILGCGLKYGGGDKSGESASLDRIDSSKGYTKDNVHVISLKANLMKSDATVEEMKLFAEWVLSEYETYEKLAGKAK